MNIEIKVVNKIAKQTDNTKIVCGNNDYIVNFDFDEEWESYQTKTARFSTDSGYEDIVFTGNSCTAPTISDALGVKIGVYAGNLHTTTPAYVDCVKSILCAGGSPADPVPSVYNQLQEELNKKADENQGAENVGKFWTVGEDGGLTLSVGGGGGGEGTSDHTRLINRDADNQHPMSAITGLQTAIDGKQPIGDYLTEETDPTVPLWAKQVNKPTYTAEEVGALSADTEIPSKTSELQNDSGFLTEHQDLSSYATKEELPTVPTNVSAFENDCGYLVEHQSLAEYRTAAEQNAIDETKQDRPTIKTAIDVVAVANTQYYLGEQAVLALNLPQSASAGQIITVDFSSGSTPTALTVSGNVAGDIGYTPKANTLIEINFKYDGMYWKMLVSSIDAPNT